MASSAIVSVSSVAGDIILPAVHLHDNRECIQALIQEVRAATQSGHVKLVTKTGQTLVDSLSARENGIVNGDQVTAVFDKRDVLWLLPVKCKYIVRYDIATDTARGIKHDGRRLQGTPYGGAVCVGNKTCFMPVDSDAMLVHNNITEEVTRVDVSGYASGGGKFSAAIAANNKVYLVPSRSDKLLVYDVLTCDLTGVDIRHITSCRQKWHSAVLHGDSIIAFPASAKAILVYNIMTGEASGIPVLPHCRSPSCAGEHLVQHGGKIYVLPNEHNKLLIYDCDSQAVSEVDVDNFARNRVWHGGAVVDGRLFALPKNGNFIWKYDTVFQTSSYIDVSEFGGGWGKMANVDGVIYCAPFSCSFILEYNTRTGEIFGTDATWFTQDRCNVFTDIVVVEDKLYFVPHSTSNIMVYDIAQRCISAIDVSEFSTGGGTSNWQYGVHMVEH